MMKYLWLPILLLAATSNYAQNNPKKNGDKPPTQKEMAKMMQEMQDAMNGMSAEDKRMMDSLGIKMPDMKKMQQTASFAAANAKSNTAGSLPARDAARIAALPKTALTAATLPAYLQTLYQKIKEVLPATLQEHTLQDYEQLRKKYPGKNILPTTAAGYWVFGNYNGALLLMSKACMENPADGNGLNNLAAMLTMRGGEHLALPLLQMLNKQYPNNSTILNNIAQAWFGLGDMANTSKYLDSTIRICAWHPQANQTKAAISRSQGKDGEAIQQLKQSISHAYSMDKEHALNELGYKLKPEDILWGPPNTPDQLGLSRFSWPPFPMNVDESEALQSVWEGFRKDCDAKMAVLDAEIATQTAAFQEAYQKRAMHDLKAAQTGSRSPALFEGFSPKAEIKLRPGIDRLLALEEKDPFYEALQRLQDSIRGLEEETANEIKGIPGGDVGEGKRIDPGYCAAVDAANSKLLGKANSLVEEFEVTYRERAKRRILEMTTYQYYTEFPEKFDLSVSLAKKEWLSLMMMPYEAILFRNKSRLCSEVNVKPGRRHGLADFDDFHCNYKDTMNLYIGTIINQCGRTKAELEIGNLDLFGIAEFSIGVETKSADREENRNFLDEFQKGSVEIGVSKTVGFNEGPLQLQAELGATGFVEFDRTGISDVGVKGTGSVKAVIESPKDKQDKSISGLDDIGVGAGVEVKVSINSGFSIEPTGILKKILMNDPKKQ